MSNPNLKPSLRAPVIAVIPSVSQSVGTATIAGSVDMGLFINVMAVATVGAFGTDATATMKFEQSTLEDFSDAKDIVGRTAIDLSEDLPGVINLKANDLDTNNGFRYVRPVITVGTAAVLVGAAVLGFDAKDQPADPLTGTIVD